MMKSDHKRAIQQLHGEIAKEKVCSLSNVFDSAFCRLIEWIIGNERGGIEQSYFRNTSTAVSVTKPAETIGTICV